MTNIIVVFPKPEDTQNICRLLRRNGYAAMGCTGPTSALQLVDELGEGIILCGYKIRGMLFSQLHEMLPPSFKMLLVASQQLLSEGVPQGIEYLSMPIGARTLTEKLAQMQQKLMAEKKTRRSGRVRTARAQEKIEMAKRLLMEKHQITEQEAHRYLQKTSMDSGRNLTESAEMIISLMTGSA